MGKPEVWLRGPLPDIPPRLQPVAHSLVQSREEVESTLPGLSAEQLWMREAGAASVGYHVRHAANSLDRLFTYARGEMLSDTQLAMLAAESQTPTPMIDVTPLMEEFSRAIERALAQLRSTNEEILLEPRAVGRGRLPSTVIGLLFHGAEHTQRHMGQMVTTAKFVRASAVQSR
jgi:uncharacterized damage-inducible protein DinB